MTKQHTKEFYQGVAIILGWLARDRREDSLVEYAMNDNGISLNDLRDAGVVPFDLGPIRKSVAKDESGLRFTGFPKS